MIRLRIPWWQAEPGVPTWRPARQRCGAETSAMPRTTANAVPEARQVRAVVDVGAADDLGEVIGSPPTSEAGVADADGQRIAIDAGLPLQGSMRSMALTLSIGQAADHGGIAPGFWRRRGREVGRGDVVGSRKPVQAWSQNRSPSSTMTRKLCVRMREISTCPTARRHST